jgi:hypothetical protein
VGISLGVGLLITSAKNTVDIKAVTLRNMSASAFKHWGKDTPRAGGVQRTRQRVEESAPE